jgi:hypothetical protein
MKRSAPHQALALFLFVSAAAVGCGGKGAEAPEDADDAPDLTFVNSTVVVGSCPDASKGMNAKAASAAIRKLVAPCSKVPGGGAHFSATLMPGGRITLASPEGDAADGVVPTCVLSNQLEHRVMLKNPCKLDVRLEERQVEGAAPQVAK